MSREEFLKGILDKHGICEDCGEFYSYHLTEGFASCKCKTSGLPTLNHYQNDLYCYKEHVESIPQILFSAISECQRQDDMWGGPDHDDSHPPGYFVQLIQDYAGWARVKMDMDQFDKAQERLTQVIALCVACSNSLDRKRERIYENSSGSKFGNDKFNDSGDFHKSEEEPIVTRGIAEAENSNHLWDDVEKGAQAEMERRELDRIAKEKAHLAEINDIESEEGDEHF